MKIELETDLLKKLISCAQSDLESTESVSDPGIESVSNAVAVGTNCTATDTSATETELAAGIKLSKSGGCIETDATAEPKAIESAGCGSAPGMTRTGDETPVSTNEKSTSSKPGFGEGEIAPASSKRGLILSIIIGAMLLVSMSVWGNHTAWNKLTNAGVAAAQLQHYADAEKLLQQALKESEKFGHQDGRVATSLSNLAETYRLKGDLDRAEPLQRKALQIRQQLFGENFPAVATSYISIGMLKEQQREFVDAEKCYERAVAIRKNCASVEDISFVLLRLASLRRNNHNELGALPLYEEALRLQLSASTNTEGRLREIWYALASIYEDANLPKDAWEKWLSLMDRKGQELEFAEFAGRLARNQPRAIQEKLYERAAVALERYFASHRNVDITNYSLQLFHDWAGVGGYATDFVGGMRYSYSGDHAIRVFKRELAMVESSLGNENHVVARILNSLVQCKSLSIPQRTEYAERAIRIWEKFVHQNSKLWDNKTSVNYGDWELDDGIAESYLGLIEIHPEKAAAIRKHQEKMWKDEVGLDSAKMAAVYYDLASNLSTAERKQLFDKSVATFSKLLLRPATGANQKLMNRALLNQASDLFQRWSGRECGIAHWRRSDVVNELYMARQQLALFEKAAGADEYFVGHALNAVTASNELPENEREPLCKRAIEIWRRNLCLIDKYDSNQLRTFSRRDVRDTFSQWDRETSVRGQVVYRPSKNSESIARQRVGFWEKAFGPEDVEVAMALSDLGKIETLSDAERSHCFERAISIWDKSTPRYDNTYFHQIKNAFDNWAKIGDRRAASSVLRKAITLLERKWLNSDGEYASVLMNLAMKTSDREEKIRCLKRATSMWVKLVLSAQYFATEDLDQAFTLIAVQDDGTLAQEIVTQELNLWDKSGVHSPRTRAAALTRLSRIEGISVDSRIKYLEEATSIWESQARLDEAELKTAMGVFDNCACLYKTNWWQKSRAVWRRAIVLCEKQGAVNSPMLAISLNKLALDIQQDSWESNRPMTASDIVACRNLYERALGVWKKQAAGEFKNRDYPVQMQSSLWGLARLSPAKEAEKLYEKAVHIEGLPGKVNNDYFKSVALSRLCVFYARNGNIEKAKSLCNKVLAETTSETIKNNARKLLAALCRQSAAIPAKSHEVDFGPYMQWTNIQMQQLLHPPSGSGVVHVVFKVATDGRIANVHPTEWSGSLPLNQSCIEAIEQASPFMPLPKGAPPFVDIEFTFTM